MARGEKMRPASLLSVFFLAPAAPPCDFHIFDKRIRLKCVPTDLSVGDESKKNDNF